jgi:hypothetical protein
MSVACLLDGKTPETVEEADAAAGAAVAGRSVSLTEG